MTIILFVKHLILLAVGLYWFTIFFILAKWDIDKRKTISDHMASGTPKKMYTASTLIYIPIILLFLWSWFLPTLSGSMFDYILVIVAGICLMLTSIIPREGSKALPHDLLANVLGLSLYILVAHLAFSSTSGYVRVASITILASILLIATLLREKDHRNYLLAQILYYGLMHVLIIFLTYTA